MGDALERTMMDRESYLRWETEQETKHEYLKSEIFAMVGVRREHAIVTLTLGRRLQQHLRGLFWSSENGHGIKQQPHAVVPAG